MKKVNFLITFLYAAFLIVGCTPKEESAVFEFSTVNKFRISEEAQQHLPRMYTSVVDNPKEEELAFSNFTTPMSIVIMDYEGEFIEKIGEEGRGPDEIQSNRYFGFDGSNNLVILDKTGASFVLFNRATNETTSFDYPIKSGLSVTSRNLEFCNGYWYLGMQLLGQPTFPETPTIGVFDSTFTLTDSLGGYDPFFQGQTAILQEPQVAIDCEEGLIFTTQSKIPYIQVFSIDTQKFLGKTNKIPPSFMLSDKFVSFVSNPREWTRYLNEEQSVNLRLAYSDKYILNTFRNGNNVYSQPRNFNDSDHFVAVYDKHTLSYLGEIKMPGTVLGYTKRGELIVLTDERNSELQFLKIEPVGKE